MRIHGCKCVPGEKLQDFFLDEYSYRIIYGNVMYNGCTAEIVKQEQVCGDHLWRSCELFLSRDISRVRRTSEISLPKTMNNLTIFLCTRHYTKLGNECNALYTGKSSDITITNIINMNNL